LAVRIRLARTGRTNRPFFRVCVYDSRTRRDGKPIEQIGHYDPLVKEFEKAVVIDVDRALSWIGKGAKCTETIASFLKRKGATLPRNVVKGGNRSTGKKKGAGGEKKAAAAKKSKAAPAKKA
jgi:small subunit ribosomal protein S16